MRARSLPMTVPMILLVCLACSSCLPRRTSPAYRVITQEDLGRQVTLGRVVYEVGTDPLASEAPFPRDYFVLAQTVEGIKIEYDFYSAYGDFSAYLFESGVAIIVHASARGTQVGDNSASILVPEAGRLAEIGQVRLKEWVTLDRQQEWQIAGLIVGKGRVSLALTDPQSARRRQATFEWNEDGRLR